MAWLHTHWKDFDADRLALYGQGRAQLAQRPVDTDGDGEIDHVRVAVEVQPPTVTPITWLTVVGYEADEATLAEAKPSLDDVPPTPGASLRLEGGVRKR